MRAFKDVFDESPDILVRVIQVIMIRLQRVTFTALRNYLGLHAELVQPKPKRPTTQQGVTTKSSPVHKRDFAVPSGGSETSTKPDMLADLTESVQPTRRISAQEASDDKLMLNLALEGFVKELGLSDKDKHLLEGNIELREVQSGVTVVTEGVNEDVCLLYVLSGSLSVLQHGQGLPSASKKDLEVSIFKDQIKSVVITTFYRYTLTASILASCSAVSLS